MKNPKFMPPIVMLAWLLFGANISTSQTPGAQNGKPACKYPAGFQQVDVGNSPKNSNNHCNNQCVKKMNISIGSAASKADDELTVTFSLDQALGGPNMLCASTGIVNWGDGTEDNFPSIGIRNCDKSKDLPKIAGPYVVHVEMKHNYKTSGDFCVSAQMYGNHKYDGEGSCSYDCVVRGNTVVHVLPAK